MKLRQLFIVCALCTCLIGCSSNNTNNSTEVIDSTEVTESSEVDDNLIESSESVMNEITFSDKEVLSDFDIKDNLNYYFSTAIFKDTIIGSPIVLSHDINLSKTGFTDKIYFSTDYILYSDINSDDSYIISYDEFQKKGNSADYIKNLKEAVKGMYYDIIVVDAYTSICGDENSDIKSYYNSLDGAVEKAKRGDSYTVKYNSYGKEVTVEYNYGMDNEKPYVNIKAEYPEGYDGIRILGLGQDSNSCTGMYATLGNESMKPYISKKDLSKVFKVWGTDNDKDFLELNNYADFIFSKKDLWMDTVSLGNQYFFGGALDVFFNPDTFIYTEDDSAYTVPSEETWVNMLKTQTITIYNPYLD